MSSFKGRFPETDPRGHFANSRLTTEVLIGTWSKAGETDSKPFYLILDNATYRKKGEGRYAAAGVKDDGALEKKAQQFREAVITKNKGVVANLISYPIVISIAGKRRKLRSQAALVANYNRIFSQRCVEVIQESVPHNMFVRYDGVSLDSGGLVWFGEDGKVIAINTEACTPNARSGFRKMFLAGDERTLGQPR